MNRHGWFALFVTACAVAAAGPCYGQSDPLPPGARAVWDLAKAHREATTTRERVCINGLWRWQPAPKSADRVPEGNWGYFKVPGCWPGRTDYQQKDSQTLFAAPAWKTARLADVRAAWYQREITVPPTWEGRRITVQADYVNSYAAVFVNDAKVGEILFPGGEVDLTPACHPGNSYRLSLMVVAMPLKGVMMSYNDTMGAKEVQGSVERRGLCGDVWLVGTPKGARLDDVRVRTSVRKWEITCEAAVQDLLPGTQYFLRARVNDHGHVVREFTGKPFRSTDVNGRWAALTAPWKPDKLWDLNTPGNQYDVSVSLVTSGGKVADTALPTRFGFRELRIVGRDFYLNGTRIYLCAVPLDNCQIGAAQATYQAVRETLRRVKAFGVNCVYTHNYGCEPGTHLAFTEALRAADDEGVLVALSQPHFGQYDWKAPDAEKNNGYARHAAFYVHVAGSHPSVVFYATSHNALGYAEDENPDYIDGVGYHRPDWERNRLKTVMAAEGILKRLDPSRVVYHHSSGDMSVMYTLNFYMNFTPMQEISDWFQHWSTEGVKPLFLCEYAVPGSLDWTMFRGWYKGVRTFGDTPVPWEFCLAEWDAQFLGDQSYKVGEWEKQNLRFEARNSRAGALTYRWNYPHPSDALFEQRYPVYAAYNTDNIRAFRTLGVSATNIWEYATYWTPRSGLDRRRKEIKTDWDTLQQPGFSPDYIEDPFEGPDVAYERTDWIPTVAAQAVMRNNMPLLAYIGGKADAVTSKDHNFTPGETVNKQLVLINNSRQTVMCACRWSLALPTPATGAQQITIQTGQQARVPLNFPLPADAPSGSYALTASVKFSSGEVQTDSFTVDILPRPKPVSIAARIALFDPKGETAKLLSALGVHSTPVANNADLSAFDMLIVGKGALTLDGAAPDIARVRDGLKVIVFEQTGDVMEKRFGFRIAEYGLRNVFRRVPDSPALAGLTEETLQNWRGDATLLPPRLKYTVGERYAPEVEWCGMQVTRVWRAGNRGNVASVLLEKPARGDFMPLIDGGYSLQYSPLMEYREGKGVVLFCQMDVSGRTDGDPAAAVLARNIIQYVSDWKPATERTALYAGGPEGRKQLERTGITPVAFDPSRLSPDRVLVVGVGGGEQLASGASAIADFVKAGGHVLALGLNGREAGMFLPEKVETTSAEHIAAWFAPFGKGSPFEGVSPADVHNRNPREMPLVSGGASVVGDGVLARATDANIVFCQITPYDVATHGVVTTSAAQDPGRIWDRRTFRRSSYLLTRLLANMGVAGSTPLLERFHTPVKPAAAETRWLEGLYLDTPEEWDDPYRFFGW